VKRDEMTSVELVCGRFVHPVVRMCDDFPRSCTSLEECTAAQRCLGLDADLGRVPEVFAAARSLWGSRVARETDVTDLVWRCRENGSAAELRDIVARTAEAAFDAILAPVLSSSFRCADVAGDAGLLHEKLFGRGGGGVPSPARRIVVRGAWFAPTVATFATGDAMRPEFMPTIRLEASFSIDVRSEVARHWLDESGKPDGQKFDAWQRESGCWLADYTEVELDVAALPDMRAPLFVATGFADDARLV
jgi:hypothetical protein